MMNFLKMKNHNLFIVVIAKHKHLKNETKSKRFFFYRACLLENKKQLKYFFLKSLTKLE
jgi:hypothetical protein